MGQVTKALAAVPPAQVAAAVAAGQPVVAGAYTLEPDEVLVAAKEREGYAVAQEAGYTVALDTTVKPDLADEGLARELVHRLQTLRRDAGFEIADRITVNYAGDADVRRVMQRFADYVKAEPLAPELAEGQPVDDAHAETQNVDGREVTLAVRRVAG